MKAIFADLLDDVVSSYDQTKTTIQGRAISKVISGDTALGPPLNKFLDVFTDAAVTPFTNIMVCTPNGRIFTMTSETSGIVTMVLYTINFATGATSYVGKLNINLPDNAATAHVYRSIKVQDTGTTGWKIFISTTATPLINGGTFLVNNVDLADFVPIGFATLPFATSNNQKAVYFLQDPANIGVGQLQQATTGSVLDVSANRLYVHNGIFSGHQYYVYDTSVSPTYTTSAITGTEATNTINHATHTFSNNDPIVFTALTGGAGLVAGTVYYVRNSVAGVSYEVSLTTGGASVNFTTDISSGTVGRAFGTTGSNFVHKTGNLPSVIGAILTTDSEDFAQPTGTGITAIDGFDCAFFATASNLYLGRLSELTSGAVTWPSLSSVNLLGTPNQILAPAAAYATWSNALNRAIYITLTNIFVMKPFANNTISSLFGGNNNRYFEGIATDVVELQVNTIIGLDVESGYLFALGSATGQRGIFVSDLRSDAQFDYSYIVTKVLDTPNAVYKFITTIDKLFDFTGSLEVYYRTSGFGSISGGWVLAPFASDLSALASGQQTQFKILFSTLGLDTSIPAQLCEFALSFSSLNEISDNWEYGHDDSDPGNPSRAAFRLKKAYASSVPTVYFKAYDLSGTLVASHNTSANPSFFQYSTDSGANWLNLGTIPNTVGTLVRYNFSTPPGVPVRPSLRES